MLYIQPNMNLLQKKTNHPQGWELLGTSWHQQSTQQLMQLKTVPISESALHLSANQSTSIHPIGFPQLPCWFIAHSSSHVYLFCKSQDVFTSLTFWTFSVNSSSNHLWSLITSLTGIPLILAFRKSGTCRKSYRNTFRNRPEEFNASTLLSTQKIIIIVIVIIKRKQR